MMIKIAMKEKHSNNLFAAEFQLHKNGNYGLDVIDKIAHKKKINLLNLVRKNYEIYDELRKEAETLPWMCSDNNAILSYDDESVVYYTRGVEIWSKEGFQITIIGNHEGKIKPYQNIRKALDIATDKKIIPILHHPTAHNRFVARDIPPAKLKELLGILRDYSGYVCMDINALCKPYVKKIAGFLTKILFNNRGGSDTNMKTKKIQAKLSSKGYNVPLLTNTDIHARYPFLLNEMDRALVYFDKSDVDQASGEGLIKSIKESIFNGKYSLKTLNPEVSFLNFAAGFGLPYIFPGFFDDVRG